MSGYPESKIEALKKFIAASEDTSELCKKVVLWLIEQSDGLTKPVKTSTTDKRMGQDMAFGVHDMDSSLCSTHLSNYLKQEGIKAYFTSCSTKKGWHVIICPDWPFSFSEAEEILFDLEAINAVVLPS